MIEDPETRQFVLVPRDTYAAIEDAIRARHITYHDEHTANVGLQNLIVWGHPHDDYYIILIAGES